MSNTVWTLNHTSHHGDHTYVLLTMELAEEQAAHLLEYGIQDFADSWKLKGKAKKEAKKAIAKLLELYKAGSYSEMVTEYHNGPEFCDIWISINEEEVMTKTFSPRPMEKST